MVNSLFGLSLERSFTSWASCFFGIHTVCYIEKRGTYHLIDCTRGEVWPLDSVNQRYVSFRSLDSWRSLALQINQSKIRVIDEVARPKGQVSSKWHLQGK